MNLKNYLFLLVLLLAAGVRAQAPSGNAYPKREFRAAWIQAVNGQFRGIPTEKLKQTLVGQLNSLQGAGINAIIFQVRPEADALYASQHEPWSRFLTGTQGQMPSPMWDPMQFMIEECHKRNMEFHAWINPYRVKTSLKNQLAPTHIYHEHPEWFVTYGDQIYFDPALPESREHICKIVSDIVSRYDVDAIHMDDYFYPYPIKGVDFPDNASFARYGGGFSNKADWRRGNVNILIKKLHETIRGIKPWVKFGISPFGIYRNQKTDPLGSNTNGLQNYDDLYADVLLWAREGWIDYNIPQIYWEIGHKAADYETLVDWWAKHAENRPLFIGQAVMNTIQHADPKNPSINQLPRKMALQRSYQTIGGSCQWYAAAVVENAGKYRDALVLRRAGWELVAGPGGKLQGPPPAHVPGVFGHVWRRAGGGRPDGFRPRRHDAGPVGQRPGQDCLGGGGSEGCGNRPPGAAAGGGAPQGLPGREFEKPAEIRQPV